MYVNRLFSGVRAHIKAQGELNLSDFVGKGRSDMGSLYFCGFSGSTKCYSFHSILQEFDTFQCSPRYRWRSFPSPCAGHLTAVFQVSFCTVVFEASENFDRAAASDSRMWQVGHKHSIFVD